MGGLLQWCCFVILLREFIAMDGVREGFWWTFSKILRYVKGSGNIFRVYLFEILCHLWGVMEMKVVAMKIVAMGNVAIKYVVMINVAIENVAMKKNLCVYFWG